MPRRIRAIRFVVILAVLVGFLLPGGDAAFRTALGSGAPSVAAQTACPPAGQKLVLAFYYPWFDAEDTFDRRKGELSDLPATPYSSSDPGAIDRHMRHARSACVDALIVAWTGPGTAADLALPLLLDAAERRGLSITIYFETDSIMRQGDVAAQLRSVAEIAAQRRAFLKWQGRPVIFFWRAEAYGGPDKWLDVRRQVDPGHSHLWSLDTVNLAFLDAFDDIHLYSAGKWAADTDVAAVNARFRNEVEAYNRAHATARSFTPGVIPGWDEGRLQPPRTGPKVFPRRGGALYDESWRAALSIAPRWVTITSFNEWFEGTQIEPSVSYGDRYLTLTREWACRFKGGCGPDGPRDQVCEAMNTRRLCGRFLDYWRGHGGLAQLGYPISEQMEEQSDTDGNTYRVQYFERAVFELHPENQAPHDVLLSLLGRFLYRQKYPEGAPGQRPNISPSSVSFAQTGKRLGGRFLDYWQSHGGLAQQGYPISDEFMEKSDLDSKLYLVQYFERAVFELHPENQPPYDVLLSQLGKYRYRQKYAQP